jgi:hypothetical protein
MSLIANTSNVINIKCGHCGESNSLRFAVGPKAAGVQNYELPCCGCGELFGVSLPARPTPITTEASQSTIENENFG